MAQFSVDEAKSNLSKLITYALGGGEVVIAVGSVPAVRLVPVAPRGRRRFGVLKGKIAIISVSTNRFLTTKWLKQVDGHYLLARANHKQSAATR